MGAIMRKRPFGDCGDHGDDFVEISRRNDRAHGLDAGI